MNSLSDRFHTYYLAYCMSLAIWIKKTQKKSHTVLSTVNIPAVWNPAISGTKYNSFKETICILPYPIIVNNTHNNYFMGILVSLPTWLDCLRSRSLLRPRTSNRGIIKGGRCPRTSLTLMLTPKGLRDSPPWTATRSMSPNTTRMELLIDLTRPLYVTPACLRRRPRSVIFTISLGTGLGGLAKVISYTLIIIKPLLSSSCFFTPCFGLNVAAAGAARALRLL